MQNTERNILENEAALLRPLSERWIEQDFKESSQHQIATIKMLSDYALLHGYRHLIDELESEEKPDLKERLLNEINLFETELTSRSLLDKALAI